MPGIKQVLAGIFCVASLARAATLQQEGLAAFDQGRYTVAIAKLRSALNENPKDRSTAVFLALAQAGSGDCGSAGTALDASHVAGLAPKLRRLAGLTIAKCQLAAGSYVEGLGTLQNLLHEFPGDADALYLSARLHMKAFNDATAAMYKDVPDSYRVNELSAQIFEIQNQYANAISEYRKAIEKSPRTPDLHFRLGRALLLEKHDSEALRQAEQAFQAELEISPEDAACELQLGQIAQVRAQLPEAKRHFAQAVQLSPDFVQALLSLARLELKEKQWPQAIARLVHAAELEPANEAVHYTLLAAYRDSGDLQKARAEKVKLDQLQKVPEGEFSQFLKKLGEKPQQ